MWPFSSCDDDACVLADPNAVTLSAIISLVPFAAVFIVVNVLTVRHVFPRLNAAHDESRDGDDHVLPTHAPAALRQAHSDHGVKSWRRRTVAWTFGTTVALAATLGALILAEIVEMVAPAARNLALRLTVPTLLFFLVVLVPWLECRSLVSGAGWSFQRTAKGRRPRVAWMMQLVLFALWLTAFSWVGNAVPVADLDISGSGRDADLGYTALLIKACLERVGVVGISLMALLSGFASVSTPWHTMGEVSPNRKKPVTEGDINRKQAGLEAATEMLASKRHRLQALERKASGPDAAATRGLVGKMVSSFRGATADETEMRALRMEISGLQTMEANLASNLSLMRARRAESSRAATPLGRILTIPSYAFSAYCIYRVLATTFTTVRRVSSPSVSFASSDPINRLLGLLARHWDPKLDQLAWARTISFALTGVILLASANSAIMTFHLFAKWTPGLLRHAHANLALAVGQVAATYVISASLLLRSQLPSEARSAVGGVLRGALSPAFVDSWFEGWFLAGSAVTGVGIWLGRKMAEEDWDEGDDVGAKRS